MAFMTRLRTAAGEAPLALRLRFMLVAAARASELEAAADSAVCAVAHLP